MEVLPKRVLQVIYGIEVDSGTSSVVMNLYRNIDKTKLQFDFLICGHKSNCRNTYENEIIAMGGKIFSFNFSFFNYLKNKKEIELFFKNNSKNYIAVHLHSPSVCEFTIKHAKKYNWKNRIVHSHSTMMSPNIIKRLIHKFLLRNIVSYGNIFWACSTEAAFFLYGKKIKAFEIVKNAVNTDRFYFSRGQSSELKKEMNLYNKIVVLHVSNYAPIKNMCFFAEVMNRVKNENIHYIFVGEGKELNSVKEKINRYKLNEKCTFVGKTCEVEKYYAMADAFVLPSIREGLPVTVIEAQASGVPCLVSSTITKEANAGLVSYIDLDYNKWADSLSMLKMIDDEQRNKNCKIFKQSQFDLKKESLRVQNLYLSMV